MSSFNLLVDVANRTTWDAIQPVLTTLTTAGVLALLALNWWLRDNVRDLIKDIHDRNGLRHRVDDLDKRMAEMEAWRIREDALDEAERELMRDVGRTPERLRDKLHGTKDE